MPKVKLHYVVVSIFALISLVCIGFSSWVMVGQTGSAIIGGEMTASPVMNYNEYVYLDTAQGTNGVDTFTIAPGGFQDGNGTITCYYKINYDKLKTLGSTVTVDFYLRGIDAYNETFNTLGGSAYYIDATISGVTPIGELDTSKTSTSYYVLTVTLNTAANSGTVDATVDYTFVISQGNYGYFYRLMGGDNGTLSSQFFVHTRVTAA